MAQETSVVSRMHSGSFLQKKGADLSRDEENIPKAEGVFALTSGSTFSRTEHPLLWGNPVFARGELGPVGCQGGFDVSFGDGRIDDLEKRFCIRLDHGTFFACAGLTLEQPKCG